MECISPSLAMLSAVAENTAKFSKYPGPRRALWRMISAFFGYLGIAFVSVDFTAKMGGRFGFYSAGDC
jgi:hypothetical protein